MAQLTTEALALLDAISKSESNGKSNVIYGGSTFSDFGKHPQKNVTITSGPNKGSTSSAAGKYQITYTTYKRVAPKLGITDFSPESQQQIAWYLAKEKYGPGLQKALESNDPATIKGVAAKLSGVWTSLPSGIEQGTTGNKFYNAYSNSLGNPNGQQTASDAINSAFPSALDQSLMSYATGGTGSKGMDPEQVSRMYAGIYPTAAANLGNVPLPRQSSNTPSAVDQAAGIVGQDVTPVFDGMNASFAGKVQPMPDVSFDNVLGSYVQNIDFGKSQPVEQLGSYPALNPSMVNPSVSPSQGTGAYPGPSMRGPNSSYRPTPMLPSLPQSQSLPGMLGRGLPSPGAIDQLAGIVGQSQTPHIGDTDPQAAARRPPMDWAAFKPGMDAGGLGSLMGSPLQTPSIGMSADQASQLYAGIYPLQTPSGLQTRSVTTVPIDPHTGNPIAPVAAPFVSEDHPTSNAVPRPAYNPGVPDWMVRRQAAMAIGSPQTNIGNFTDPLSPIGQAPSWASLQAFNPQSALPSIPPRATVPGAAYAAAPNTGGVANDVGSGASWGDVQSFNAPADKTTYYPKGQNYGYNTSTGNYEVKQPSQAYSYGSLPANTQFSPPSVPAYNPNTFGAADLVKVPSSVNIPQYITINKQVQIPGNLPIATGDGVHWDAALGNYVMDAAPAAPKMQTVTKQVRVPNPAYVAPTAQVPKLPAANVPTLGANGVTAAGYKYVNGQNVGNVSGMSGAAAYQNANQMAAQKAIAQSSNPSSNSARSSLASSWGFE